MSTVTSVSPCQSISRSEMDSSPANDNSKLLPQDATAMRPQMASSASHTYLSLLGAPATDVTTQGRAVELDDGTVGDVFIEPPHWGHPPTRVNLSAPIDTHFAAENAGADTYARWSDDRATHAAASHTADLRSAQHISSIELPIHADMPSADLLFGGRTSSPQYGVLDTPRHVSMLSDSRDPMAANTEWTGVHHLSSTAAAALGIAGSEFAGPIRRIGSAPAFGADPSRSAHIGYLGPPGVSSMPGGGRTAAGPPVPFDSGMPPAYMDGNAGYRLGTSPVDARQHVAQDARRQYHAMPQPHYVQHLGVIPVLPPLSPHSPHNGAASKTKVCRFYLGRNNNHFGKTCSFVHPCRNMLIEGHCKHGR